MANKKITFELDVDGKPIDVVIDKTLNLKQAVRELTKEINKTKEGTEEFRLLSAKLNETKDNVDRVNAKSRELFGTMSLLPGPIGQFGNELDNSINLLKTFSGFKLSDIGNQFKELGKDALDVIKNILGLNVAQKGLAVSEVEATAAAGAETVALGAQTTATEAAEVATIGLGTALKAIGIGFLLAGLALLVAYWDKIKDALTGVTQETKRYNEVNQKALDKNGDQIVQLELLSKQVKSGTLTQREKNKAVNDYNDKLGETLGKVTSYAELEAKLIKDGPDYIKYLKTKSIAEAAYQLAIEKGKEALKKGMEDATSNAGWQDYLSGFLESNDFEKTLRVQGEVNRGVAVAELNKDKDAYMAIFNTAEGEANKLADKLKIKVPEIKYTGDTKNITVKENQNKELIEKEKQFQSELTVVTTQGEKERANKELEAQYQKEKRDIESLKISKDKEGLRQKALTELKQVYDKKKLDSDKKFDEEEAKKNDEKLKTIQDFERKATEIRIGAIKNETNRAVAEREQKYKNDLVDLENDKLFIAKGEEEKAELRKALITSKENDIAKIKIDAKLKEDQIEKGDRDARYARIAAGAKNDLDLQRQILEEKKKLDDDYYATQLAKEGLTTEQIKALNDKKLEDQIFYTQKSNEIEQTRIAVKQKALDDIISIAGAETEVGRAALIAKQIIAAQELIMEIRKTITFSTQAAARSVVAVAEGTAQTAKIGFPQNIPMLIGYAAQAVAIISAIVSAVSSAKSSANADAGGASGATVPGANSVKSLGRNYGDGGMIDGPLHAGGGVMVNAEGGEAVMTRGAVTMFAPLLSAMNQMGGGTAFSKGAVGQANYDTPKVNTMDTQIIKTYVVSSELTTNAEKLARLKDLSTL